MVNRSGELSRPGCKHKHVVVDLIHKHLVIDLIQIHLVVDPTRPPLWRKTAVEDPPVLLFILILYILHT